MIALSPLDVFDLFLRFSATGILFLLIGWFIAFSHQNHRHSAVALIVCVISYILLTTPVPNDDYGYLRQPLLLFTDLTAFAILWFSHTVLQPETDIRRVSKWTLYPIGLWCTWLSYFFLFTDGKGPLHDLSHLVGFTVLIIVVYKAAEGYFDDLVDKRRNMRLIIVAVCGIYMALLTLFELVFVDVKDTPIFSVINAMTIFLSCFIIALKATKLPINSDLNIPPLSSRKKTDTIKQEVYSRHKDALIQKMNDGAYKQPGLTISALAKHMNVPEHQLRQLINKELGFSNFSHYLNSYRIPDVCEQLKDKSKEHIPILTLALDAGFGSIASFNRAFKQQIGVTPTEFRAQF
ncbi:helix-turn-helix domain-containing protein [Thalassotalea euphylliae]|uniref:AraC family transcriptional regulator n=1 Tax=Thalassotalea euphylliae TaxID=1655234 RepID=UPI003625B20D